MRPKRVWVVIAAGVMVLMFGLGCLNYTAAEGLDRHRQQALRYNLPPPTHRIFRMGVVSTAVGGGLVGYGLARRRG
jgi:hypothetical protein